jgi:hypothetical protein
MIGGLPRHICAGVLGSAVLITTNLAAERQAAIAVPNRTQVVLLELEPLPPTLIDRGRQQFVPIFV